MTAPASRDHAPDPRAPATREPAPREPAPDAPPARRPTVAPPARGGRSIRRRLLMLSLPVALILGGGYVWLSGGRYQETENANLHQARILIASDLSGRVVASEAAENRHVAAGDLLFRVDAEPYRIALAQADAAVAAARVQVQQLKAAHAAALTRRELAQSNLDFAETESDRQAQLTKKGVATTAMLDEVKNRREQARQGLAAAEVEVRAAAAALGGDPAAPDDDHPLVRQAVAAREKAAYTLTQTEVHAPADGVLTQAASFRQGQFVAAGTPVFSLIATRDVWVDANFKETQLEGIVPGQSAEITFDAYPDRTFAATVADVGAGTGAEFSLLPAQNATGNWVKVTQRVPVRLLLAEGQDLSALRSGMSASVTVDTGRQTGLEQLRLRASAAEAGVTGWVGDHRR